MNIKKLHSANVGTHHPEQAMILTEKGEIFVTEDELQSEGYKLIKMQTYDTDELSSIVNNLLKGIAISGKAVVTIENSSILVNPVVRLYQISSGDGGASNLQQIHGGYDGQIITLISSEGITVTEGGNLHLESAYSFSSNSSTMLLQKVNTKWVELSRTVNQE